MKKNIIISFLAFAVASVLPTVSFAQQRSDWMSKISDDTYVCSMSIPGTHDSCTYGADGVITGHYARCQYYNLEEQFDFGIRCFDFRPSAQIDDKTMLYHLSEYNGHFNMEVFRKEQEITHGPIPCNITFVDAMKTIIDLIKKHPSEFAIIMVNQESSSNEDYNEIALAATQCTEWLLSQENPGMFVEFRPDLKLGDVRGKILIINRDDFNSSYKNGHTFHFICKELIWEVLPGGTSRSKIIDHDDVMTCIDLPSYQPVGAFTVNFGDEDGIGYLRTKNKDNFEGQARMFSQDNYNPSSLEKKQASFTNTAYKYFRDIDYYSWCFNNVSGYLGEGMKMSYEQLSLIKYFISDEFIRSGSIFFTFPYPGSWHRLGIVMEDFAGDIVDRDTGKTFEERIIGMNPFEQ